MVKPNVAVKPAYRPGRSSTSLSSYFNITNANTDDETNAEQSKSPSASGAIRDCHRVLSTVFGHIRYRGKQETIIAAAVRGADVFVLAPTGMGKSLCFQVPAVADKHGVTIVISPLLALMKNQVAKLREKHVRVVAFTSETNRSEKTEIVRDLSSRKPGTRLLYITPEKLFSAECMTLLNRLHENGALRRFVVDEAHCISEWGHDFRAEYRRLGTFREKFEDVPIMALTATATPTVQKDIIRSLRMSTSNLYEAMHPFNRVNLFYEVRYTSCLLPYVQMMDIYECIVDLYGQKGKPCSGIVYCRTKKMCDDLSAFLCSKGIRARPYHRGVKSAILDDTLKEWDLVRAGDGGVDVVCATIAFGMGIDKPDVRYIIHYDMPKSFEGYYQETGRAGRDGLPANCILYYSREDAIRVKQWVAFLHAKRMEVTDCSASEGEGPVPSQRAGDSLNALIRFAENTETCRHINICQYFDESINVVNQEDVKQYCDSMCDICKYPNKTRRRKKGLSSEEFAGTQVAQDPVVRFDNDESHLEDRGGADELGNDTLPVAGHSFSSTNSLSSLTNKRINTKLGFISSSSLKRVKTDYSLPLPLTYSKQFNSAALLRKPFKTPSMVAPATAPAARPAEIPLLLHETEAKNANAGEELPVVTEDVQVAAGDVPGYSSPVLLPVTDTRLEVEFSEKIELSVRRDALVTIRKALQKVFFRSTECERTWDQFDFAPSCKEFRAAALDAVARELEFAAHSLCTTAKGYKYRIEEKKEAVKKMVIEARTGKEDLDDVREAVEIVQRVCREGQRTAKMQVKEDRV